MTSLTDAREDEPYAESLSRSPWRRWAPSVVAAGIPAGLYLWFVWHYSYNLPFADDWTKIPLNVSVSHGHMPFKLLWVQYAEGRLFVPNLVYALVGRFDRFNLQVIVGLSAVTLVASYLLVLAAFRGYLGRSLTPFAIGALGLVWLSLIDTGNSLWAFQFAWYLVIFFLALMLFFLLVWPRNPAVRVTLAILAAIGGTLSMFHGFFLWPVGLACILWSWRSDRTHVSTLAAWLGAGTLTWVVFIHNYVFSHGCSINWACSTSAPTHEPVHYGAFVVALLGYVAQKIGPFDTSYVGLHLLLGACLLAAALYVVIRSLQERTRSPLVFVLVMYAMLFDVSIALGRGLGGLTSASAGRFTMPNIVLVSALIIYAFAHPPNLKARAARKHYLGVAAIVALSTFAIALTIFNTTTAIGYGRRWHYDLTSEARVLVNQDRIRQPQRDCYLNIFVSGGNFPGPAVAFWFPFIDSVRQERLYVFNPDTALRYRLLGPPQVPRICSRTFS